MAALPPGWGMAQDAEGKTYFVDHNTQSTTYNDPRGGQDPNQVPMGQVPVAYDPNMSQAPAGMVMQAGGAAPPAGDLLQNLTVYPSLLVKQKPRGACIEFCCGCESENEYKVYNPEAGKGQILTIREHSECLSRNCCGTSRPFEMSVNTIDGQEILKFDRPLRGRQGGCGCCFAEWCFQHLKVTAGDATSNPGKELGYVRENYSFCLPVFSVNDSDGNEKFRVVGNCCGCCNYTLKVYDAGQEGGTPVGRITKTWSGLGKELFTDADNFFVEFPRYVFYSLGHNWHRSRASGKF